MPRSPDCTTQPDKTTLVTLMFTLNELYTASAPRTQLFLMKLTDVLPTGALLLVVDSPGSYSEVQVNNSPKKYPMHWLLDHALLRSDKKRENGGEAERGWVEGNDERQRWEKLIGDESRWFRLPGGLRYPIELENMRYQIHLFRRV